MKMITFRPQRAEPKPADGVLRSQWRVGCRTVTMTQLVEAVPGAAGQMNVAWQPDCPRRLGKREWREYRAGRDAHYQRLANMLGGTVAVVDL